METYTNLSCFALKLAAGIWTQNVFLCCVLEYSNCSLAIAASSHNANMLPLDLVFQPLFWYLHKLLLYGVFPSLQHEGFYKPI